MIETALASGVVLLLLAVGLVAQLSWDVLLYSGEVTAALGFLLGVPPAVVYHVRLWQELTLAGASTRGIIWNPIRFHDQVPWHRQNRFLPWFYAGGVGFVIVVLGVALMGLAVVSVMIRGV
ncbi:MAG: hypothetical protein KGO50_04045 [Myxococcales bacterium]|nr:hypothetical protein [Myxococcales bacterium]